MSELLTLSHAELACRFTSSREGTGARFGIALQAVRQNEGRVAALGLSPYRIRLAAFVISGMVTGLAGALYADLNRFVSPTMMSWHLSGEIMVFIILGGVARLFGPVVGACLFVLFEHAFGSVTEHWQFFLGAALLAVVLFRWAHGPIPDTEARPRDNNSDPMTIRHG